MFRIRGRLASVIGLALIALSLRGSIGHPAYLLHFKADPALEASLRKRGDNGLKLYFSGQYSSAREIFRGVALDSERSGVANLAALHWNNAGACSLARLEFGAALNDFLHARQIAESEHLALPLANALNNLASLYTQTHDLPAALQVTEEALAGPAASVSSAVVKIRFQRARALAMSHRMDEAEPIYRESIAGLERAGDFDAAARAAGNLGSDLIDAGRYQAAEAALDEGRRLVESHKLTASGNILVGLARVRSEQGRLAEAAALFQAAIDAPVGLIPRWMLFADRGDFRLQQNQLRGALTDFRESDRLAKAMRVATVPADQDRIALESGLSRVAEGLVDAGNRLALKTGSERELEGTFNTSEQDRLWSLRALVPSANDWRQRLPGAYWDVLARYQAAERKLLADPDAAKKVTLTTEAERLGVELSQLEALAGASGVEQSAEGGVSPLRHLRELLAQDGSGRDSVVFSFHLTDRQGWMWAIDRSGVTVFAIPDRGVLAREAAEFAAAVQQQRSDSVQLGSNLYRQLFGALPHRLTDHRRWLLELDGPLFDVPFAALVPNPDKSGGQPVFLTERATLESIPDTLLLEKASSGGFDGAFLGVGDAIYNAADSRYRGLQSSESSVLPRIPGTAAELGECSRIWGSPETRILAGEQATLAQVESELSRGPAIVHFATHVISAPVRSSAPSLTGLIALSLDHSGALGFLGPADIAARPLPGSLVVLNGCHSAQGSNLPSAGLTGLTRAWIGAGARAVLATRWDVPDDAAKTMITEFYRRLKAVKDHDPASALHEAMQSLLSEDSFRRRSDLWAAYVLSGRQ